MTRRDTSAGSFDPLQKVSTRPILAAAASCSRLRFATSCTIVEVK